MKKVLAIVIVLALVLGTWGFSFGGDEVGRYQATAMNQLGMLILVDTLTGRAWRCYLLGGETVCVPLTYEAGPKKLSLFPPEAKKGTFPVPDEEY